METIYPQIEVALVGEDGNAFMMIGKVMRAMRKAGVDKAEIERFSNEAMSGDYDKVLTTINNWVTVY